ncbi:MAG: hypothetical protein IPN17_32105 [Deltaproteobacteria bacterium]|nr:hypothetical protein [Deltaproteobacteria bacterium]
MITALVAMMPERLAPARLATVTAATTESRPTSTSSTMRGSETRALGSRPWKSTDIDAPTKATAPKTQATVRNSLPALSSLVRSAASTASATRCPTTQKASTRRR